MWIIAFERSTTGHTMTDQKDIAELASRIADDLHLDSDSVYDIEQAIIEYQDDIDLSDYNATLDFIEELWNTFDLWIGA